MKLKSVSFIHAVPFGGSIKSANAFIASDVSRIGSEPFEIELVELSGMLVVSLTKNLNGKRQTQHVPLSNVACFMVLPAEPSSKK